MGRHHHPRGDQSSREITHGSHRTLHLIQELEPHLLTLVLELRPLILALGLRPVTPEQVPHPPTQEQVPRLLIQAGVRTQTRDPTLVERTQVGLTHILLRVESLARAFIQELAVTLAGPILTQLGDRTLGTQ